MSAWGSGPNSHFIVLPHSISPHITSIPTMLYRYKTRTEIVPNKHPMVVTENMKPDLFGWLVVFNVPLTARSFRDGTPIYCPLRRMWSSINTPFWPGIEPRAVTWQSITLPLRHASSTPNLELSSLWVGGKLPRSYRVPVKSKTSKLQLLLSVIVLVHSSHSLGKGTFKTWRLLTAFMWHIHCCFM